MTRVHLTAAAFCALLLSSGCSDDSSTSSSSGGNTNQCDVSELDYQDYAAGIKATAEQSGMQVEIVDAMPAPPARGANAWKVKVLGADGEPLQGGSLDKVLPFMPDHGHGANTDPTFEALDENASTTVENIDFMMGGVWTVRFDVSDGSQTDQATFAFCIDG